MVKPPAVYVAGLLRALKRGIDTEAWTWLMSLAGQELFYPPNVAGWDDSRWLDTATFRARWMIATHAIRPHELDSDKARLPDDAAKLMSRAETFLGKPAITAQTRNELGRLVEHEREQDQAADRHLRVLRRLLEERQDVADLGQEQRREQRPDERSLAARETRTTEDGSGDALQRVVPDDRRSDLGQNATRVLAQRR